MGLEDKHIQILAGLLLAVWSWASHLTSVRLSLSLVVHKDMQQGRKTEMMNFMGVGILALVSLSLAFFSKSPSPSCVLFIPGCVQGVLQCGKRTQGI